MASTGAGCLYPPHCLGEIVYDKELINKYASTADDVWIKTMALFYDVKIVKTSLYQKPLTIIKNSQNSSLTYINDVNMNNTIISRNLQRLFPDAYKKLGE